MQWVMWTAISPIWEHLQLETIKEEYIVLTAYRIGLKQIDPLSGYCLAASMYLDVIIILLLNTEYVRLCVVTCESVLYRKCGSPIFWRLI